MNSNPIQKEGDATMSGHRKAWGPDSSDTATEDDKKFEFHTVSRIEPEPSDPEKIIRGDNGCCYEMVEATGLGICLIRVQDPDGVSLDYYEKNGIQLSEDFAQIPGDIWAAWIALCFHFCPDSPKGAGGYNSGRGYTSALEVSMVLLRHEDDLSKWKAVIPKQTVGSASVEADFTENCDLLTGEKYDVFPPPGWVHAGSSHSHNSMWAGFSGTDDNYELGVPGVHIVVGKIDKIKSTYEAKGSIVVREVRKEIDFTDLVVTDVEEGTPFHEDVLGMVKKEPIAVYSVSAYSGPHSGYSGSPKGYTGWQPGRVWDPQGKRYVDPPSKDDDTRRLLLLPDLDDDDDDVLGFRGREPSEYDVHVSPFVEREEIEAALARESSDNPENVQSVKTIFFEEDDDDDNWMGF